MRKTALFLVLLLAGFLVYFVGGYLTTIPHAVRLSVKTAIPFGLLAVHVACRRPGAWSEWSGVTLGLLAASVGFLVAALGAPPINRALGIGTESVSGIALLKFVESALIVVPALVVARIGGMSFDAMYLRRGRLRLGLIVGVSTFVIFAALFVLQSLDQGMDTEKILRWTPWVLLFCFSNAFMEELHFRGLLLGPFERLLGRHGANVCIALFFTLVHAPVEYTPDVLVFLATLFPLALAWGFIIQWTKSIWASVLFHAGADLMILVGIVEAYG